MFADEDLHCDVTENLDQVDALLPDRDHPGTSDRHYPGIMIAITPEPVIGTYRNHDRRHPGTGDRHVPER